MNTVSRQSIGPALYLIPVTLSDGQSPLTVLPQCNIDILRQIRHFIVENVRSARRFIRACDRTFDIDGATFDVLDEHNRHDTPAIARMLEPLRRGEPVGVLSEAGCPAVADPGAEAVAMAQREGLRVIPLVGPSSILMSLMASGFSGQSFTFNGYLPVDVREKAARLRDLERHAARATQIFIETPYRNNRLVALMAETLRPDTLVCVASDITGPHESIITRTAAEWRRARYDYDRTPTIFLIGSNG